MNTDNILQTAVRQGGHISRKQLEAAGLSRAAIYRRTEAGTLHKVTEDVFRVLEPAAPLDIVRGAALALPSPTVSHQTAAALHAMPKVGPHPLTVSVHSRTTHTFPGVTVRRTHDLHRAHRMIIDGLPVTTISRTIVDLASLLSKQHLTDVVDSITSTGRAHPSAIGECLSQVARKGKPGVRLLRQVLEERSDPVLATASRLELIGLELIRRSGLPTPSIEFGVPWASNERFDLAFPNHAVAIEWDSLQWHAAPDRFENDRRRDRLAALHGWIVLRFTWKDVTQQPERVITEIRAVLQQRGPTERHVA